MKIAYIAAGAGGMYCGSCIRDNSLARALSSMGHQVLLQPIYTPLRTDEESFAEPKVRYGAVNLYLQQRSQLFGRLPALVRGWLDSPFLLRRLTANPSAIDARELGELTLSMLRGEAGRQKAELEELVRFLRDEYQPEIVQLTNSMLLGLARRIKQELPQVRVVTALQGEDIFLEDLRPPYREQVEKELRERARHSDLFVATSEFYARRMGDFLELDRDRVRVTRTGVSFNGYREEGVSVASEGDGRFHLGYLARVCPEKGLHLLVDAFSQLAARRPGEVVLHIAGYLGGKDEAFFAEQKAKLQRSGLDDSVRLWGEVDRETKIEFLHGLDVLSVPTEYQEPKGMPVLEAMAAGVPVVQPDHGAFPELLKNTGGGWLTAPGDVAALATQLEAVLDDPKLRQRTARMAHRGVRREYSVDRMAEETLEAYDEVLALPPIPIGSTRVTV